MPNRRPLKYQDWDAVLADLRALSCAYEQHGKWNIEQMAKHLNAWLQFPMDGFPPAPLPIRILLSIMRITMGKRMLKKIIADGKMTDGGPTMPATVYDSTTDEGAHAAIAELQQTIERFRKHTGPIHASPLFGAMDKETAERLQLVHFAHHLSWLSPA